MNRTEHLLTILAEEAVEVAQRCSKINRFGVKEKQKGMKQDNEARLWEEYDQMNAMVEMLVDAGVLTPPNPNIRMKTKDAKKLNVELYLCHSRNQGTLQESVREMALRHSIAFEEANFPKKTRHKVRK